MTILDSKTWSLPERLRRARLMAGLDESQLADMLGVARNSISNYETGRSEPNVTTFVLWAESTGSSLDWLAAGVVRPEGFEPPTYCSVADDAFWAIVAGVDLVLESTDSGGEL